MSNSFRYVSNGPKKKKKNVICPRAGLPEGSPRLGSVLPFFYLLLQFSRFLQTVFCKMLVRGLSRSYIEQIFEFVPTKNLAHWQSWCSEKSWIFFETSTLSVCQICCRQKFKNPLWTDFRQTSYEHFAKKTFVKILKIIEEDRKTVKVYHGKKQRR